MAISSPLNPGVIAPQRRTQPEKAQNFISGGSPLGSSVFNAAANNIVGFTRGAAVAPRTPDLGSIIQTLSSSILNNVESRVTQITQNVNNIVGSSIRGIQEKYAKKTSDIDTKNPNRLLNAFLGLYDRAIGYLRFLGDPKNISKLGKNLDALRAVFDETFQVATIIRQQIVRIINQLSSLPAASSSGGPGLSLDVNVPGGGLKKSAPRGLMKMMRRRPGMALATSALAGAGGMAAVNAISGGFGESDQRSLEGGLGLSSDVISRFSYILSRFSAAIDSLSNTKEQRRTVQSQGPSAGPTEPTQPDQPTTSPGSTMGAGAQGPAGAATRSLLDTIAYAEGTSKYANQGYNTHFGGGQTQDLSKHPDKVIRSGGYASAAFGRYQFMPGTWQSVGGGAMTPERQDAGAVRLTIKRLNAAGIKVKDENELETLLQKEGLSPRIAAALSPEWASFPTATGASYYGQPVKKLKGLQKVYAERLTAQGTKAPTQKALTTQVTTPTQEPPKVTPAQTQAETQKAVAQQVSQPPVQQSSDVNVVPVNLAQGPGKGGRKQTIGGESPPPPGSSVPFIMASNEDNFLTLYSKMVYNIVDG